ncbi:MAG TPA: amidohydrolase family protein, partial [Jatrophihabitans sp.]|nr:amidohydrolase family protein [Jatrophihabitans sp.]
PRGRNTGRSPEDRAAIMARWRDDVAELAAQQNVVAKHSGLGMPLLGHAPHAPVSLASRAELAELAAPLITHTQDVFGAARTMWASNFPIDKPGQDLPVSVEMLRDVLGSGMDEDALFRRNAERVYRLGDRN